MDNMFEEKIVECDEEMESLEREVPSAVQKLNERLGIKDRESLLTGHEIKSIQEMVENSKREFEKFKEEVVAQKAAVEGREEEAKSALDRHENPLTRGPGTLQSATTAIASFSDAMNVISNLASTGQEIMLKLYDAISSTDFVDSDVVESTAKIIEGVRIAVADIVAYHSTKMQLEHSYRMAVDMENLKQENRKELEILKSFLRRQETEQKHQHKVDDENRKNASAGDGGIKDADKVSWSQNMVMELLRKADADKDATVVP